MGDYTIEEDFLSKSVSLFGEQAGKDARSRPDPPVNETILIGNSIQS